MTDERYDMRPVGRVDHETVDEMGLEAVLALKRERDALRARVAELERLVGRNARDDETMVRSIAAERDAAHVYHLKQGEIRKEDYDKMVDEAQHKRSEGVVVRAGASLLKPPVVLTNEEHGGKQRGLPPSFA